jgi:Putative metal-binding motif/FG-GAP repeat
MPLRLLLLPLALLGCGRDLDKTEDSGCFQMRIHPDLDRDGYGDMRSTKLSCGLPLGWTLDASDCDDGDPSLSPQTNWYIDADRDGYGALPTWEGCSPPFGYVRNDTDCDDLSASVYPGAREFCNGVDDNCDGNLDDADPLVVDQPSWYHDDDGDGWGQGFATKKACEVPEGFSGNDLDCDDDNALVHPQAPEEDCTDPVDYNCDGEVGYEDKDEDGFVACVECADDDPDRYPGAQEWCNNQDDDCDGLQDEPDAIDANTYYLDADGDRYGDPTVTQLSCRLQSGWASNDRDCNDADSAISPAAAESCDPADEDCDGLINDDDPDVVDVSAWYPDVDGDGFGDRADPGTGWCSPPAGLVSENTDCNDADASSFPGAPELCGGGDEDCDGLVDEVEAVDASTWYQDRDGDGYGTVLSTTLACTAPASYVGLSTDCDDATANVSPAAPESCNGLDDDCDRSVDEADAVDAPPWYPDYDGDGWGYSGASLVSCVSPVGFIMQGGDCSDANAGVHPGATEVCDGVDNDCSGQVDGADALGALLWYRDADADGFGDGDQSRLDCEAPEGFVADAGDCDDANAAASPDAAERCDPLNTDEDCNGLADDADPALDLSSIPPTYEDLDGDGSGDLAILLCDPTGSTTVLSGDCDDGDPTRSPLLPELCDALDRDEDCSGTADDQDLLVDPTTKLSGYADEDGDGYGLTWIAACDPVTALVPDGGDCDDGNAAVAPNAAESCNSRDDNCDGQTDDADPVVQYSAQDLWYPDVDGDGVGAGTAYYACASTGSRRADDCADDDATVSPLEREHCADGLDQDCDGQDAGCVVLDSSLSSTDAAFSGATRIAAGDLDLDGLPDLLLAAPAELRELRSPLVGSPVAGLSWGGYSGDGFGASLLFVEDLGNGSPEVVVGAPTGGGRSPRSGYVYHSARGSGQGTLLGEITGDEVGTSLAAVDMEGDGVPDLWVGAPGAAGGAGETYLVPSPAPSQRLSRMATRLTGDTPGDRGGELLAAADFEGDGLGDVVVAGTAGIWVLLAPSGRLSPGQADANYSGSVDSLAAGGDFNQDGYPDLLVGESTAAGTAAVYSGLALLSSPLATLSGTQPTEALGAQAGWLDDQLLVGTPTETWLFPPGAGGSLERDQAILLPPGSPVAADATGDGAGDLLLLQSDGRVLLLDGTLW